MGRVGCSKVIPIPLQKSSPTTLPETSRLLIHRLHRSLSMSFLHNRRCVLLSVSFRDPIRIWARTVSFCFWLAIAELHGTVELLTEAPDQRNRFRSNTFETLTCCSLLSFYSIVKVGPLLEFYARELSNDAPYVSKHIYSKPSSHDEPNRW